MQKLVQEIIIIYSLKVSRYESTKEKNIKCAKIGTWNIRKFYKLMPENKINVLKIG